MGKNKRRQQQNSGTVPNPPALPEAPETDDSFDDVAVDGVKEEAEADVDADDWDDDAPQVHDPSEDQPGEVYEFPDGALVPVRCENCAMWNTPQPFLGDKTMCRPGKPVQVLIGDQQVTRPMSESLWSCRSYFVPKAIDLTPAVPQTPGQAAALLKATAWVKAGVALHLKASKLAERYRETNEAVVGGLPQLAAMTKTPDEYRYVYPMLQFLADNIVRRHKETKRTPRVKKLQYHRYDQVEWVDQKTGATLQGCVASLSLRTNRIDIVLTPESAALVHEGAVGSLPVRYDYQQWRALQPTVVASAALVNTTPEPEATDGAAQED